MNQQDSIEDKGNSNSPLGVKGKLGDETNSVPLQGLGVNLFFINQKHVDMPIMVG